MQPDGTGSRLSESQFAALVDAIAAAPDCREKLEALLHESHPVYAQRGAATTVRMRGWVLHALAQAQLSDTALVFVLEELETGLDPYLVAAAARALRSYPQPHPGFAPRIVRAMINVQPHDEPVSFERYGEYATSSTATTPLRELLATLAWLGAHARGVLGELEALTPELPAKLKPDVERAVQAIRGAEAAERDGETCCALPGSLGHAIAWASIWRRAVTPIEKIEFEDQDGALFSFDEFFCGKPAIVLFFYTRCDNPLKCSLTITKLARIQELLRQRRLANAIRTAAITYDPAFDDAERMRGYARNRGVHLDAANRMLRSTGGFDELRQHFDLNVNFVGSLVNRHSIEVYLLDPTGRIAFSFERLHWDEAEVVDRARELLGSSASTVPPAGVRPSETRLANVDHASPIVGTFASLGIALFPKCPFCWAGYLSVFGIAGLDQIPYAPWLQFPLLALLLAVLVSLWIRGRAIRQMTAFWIACAGALLIALARLPAGNADVGLVGVALVFAGSVLGAARMARRSSAAQLLSRRTA